MYTDREYQTRCLFPVWLPALLMITGMIATPWARAASTGTVTGRVVDLEGAPVTDVRVTLVELSRSLFVDSAGRFHGVRLHYRGAQWHAVGGAIHYDEQDELAPFETFTDGFTLVEASVGYRFKPVRGAIHQLSLRGTNLSDRLARNHVSRLKDLVPMPGRNVSLTYRAIF